VGGAVLEQTLGGRPKLGQRLVAGLVQGNAARFADDLAQRPISDPTTGGQAAAAQGSQRREVCRCSLDELADETALADPRGTEDQGEARTSDVDDLHERVLEEA